ncbi:hypothetical protein K492DRAFT_171985 [Lichtheimia hyalospora FSU 10163]|nr:hypothetical protein K492DRAFT_171985 [Lichtheimia hyalospora FSU 10163]
MSSQENTDKPVPQLPEESTAEGTKPSPSTSSPVTRRLSVLVNKAKKSISQAADKVSSPTDATHAKSSEPATTTDNAGSPDEPAAVANPTTEATSDGTEKRRSRLVENFENFFHRSKSPAQEQGQHEQPSEEHATSPAAVEDTSAAAATATPSSPTKDSMVDQMKRNPLINRFFTKKEETTATTTTDAAEASAAEPKPDEEPKAANTGAAPLGRRLTQILRSLPKGKKKTTTSSGSSSSSTHQDETPAAQSHPAAAATATTPTVQATA